MKGRVLSYSIQENSGVITCDDDNRYTFVGAEWNETEAPRRGDYVDFEPQDDKAVQIYRALGAGASDAKKEKIVAGLFAILLGGLGIHKFYLGYKTAGIIHLLIFFIGMLPLFIGTIAISLIALIEGIIYLTKSDEEFERTYVVNKKEWF